jgi:hypothetical protein
VTKALRTNATNAQSTEATGLTAFNSNGFTLGGANTEANLSGYTYAGWAFREQSKFFDVVTYTGNGSTQNIAHNLGSEPGCIIVKKTSGTSTYGWFVYHRSLSANQNLLLNTTDIAGLVNGLCATAPTSTTFSVDSTADINSSGATFVAYLFAHNAGGFGTAGTDNVISCGSFTNAGADLSVTLGYEPQWLLIKKSDSTGSWGLFDTMRGIVSNSTVASNNDATLFANTSAAETSADWVGVTSTGFDFKGSNFGGGTFIYIAIRRGPMKVPTDATKVFGLNARTGTGAVATVTGGQIADAVLIKNRGSAVADLFSSRQTGTGYLLTSASNSEAAAGTTILQASPWDVMDGVKVGTSSTITNASGNTFINYLFQRAPSFFDEVCYTGTGSVRTINHNLGVAPELILVKGRSLGSSSWQVYAAGPGPTKVSRLNTTNAFSTNSAFWNDTAPTSTVFTVGTDSDVNTSGSTFISYLFATCAGVSKVGSYTGNGSTQAIACGFAGGARFVLIKRTDSTGDWYVYDTARGMTVLTDPYLLLNSTAAESATLGSVTTTTGGFTVDASILAAINTNAASYIFLAIA